MTPACPRILPRPTAEGTLQIKVQIRNPAKYLIPELTAKGDFLREKVGLIF